MLWWLGIKSFFGSIFKFCTEHPTVLLCLACAGVGFYVGQARVVAHYNKQIQERNEKIDWLEKASKEQADKIAVADTEKRQELTGIKDHYEALLLAEKGNSKVVQIQVPVPGPTKTVIKEVMIDRVGDVVCQKLPEAFVGTINQMIVSVNKGDTP